MSNWFKQLRLHLGLTQRELAGVMFLSRATINSKEANKKYIGQPMYDMDLKALGELLEEKADG